MAGNIENFTCSLCVRGPYKARMEKGILFVDFELKRKEQSFNRVRFIGIEKLFSMACSLFDITKKGAFVLTGKASLFYRGRNRLLEVKFLKF